MSSLLGAVLAVRRTSVTTPKSTGKSATYRAMSQKGQVKDMVEIDDTASKLNTLRPYNQRIDLNGKYLFYILTINLYYDHLSHHYYINQSTIIFL